MHQRRRHPHLHRRHDFSHAAVVARGWGKCCVAGAGEIQIDSRKGTVKIKVAGKTYTT